MVGRALAILDQNIADVVAVDDDDVAVDDQVGPVEWMGGSVDDDDTVVVTDDEAMPRIADEGSRAGPELVEAPPLPNTLILLGACQH